MLERRGLLIADPEHPALDHEVGSALEQLQAASVQYKIAIGPHAGRKALTLYSVPPLDDDAQPPGLVAQMAPLRGPPGRDAMQQRHDLWTRRLHHPDSPGEVMPDYDSQNQDLVC